MRVTKDPAVRRQELVLAACELFKEKGFEQVSVSDIVQKVGVAQGTFYYYFKSKFDMLDAVVDHYAMESIEFMENVAGDQSMNATQKIQSIINYALKMDGCDRNFIEYLHSDENLITHQKFMARSYEMTIPIITGIVEEGIRDGLFHVRYSRETVEMMVYMYGHLHDSLALSDESEDNDRKMRATEDIFVRVLGVKDGVVRLIADQ